MSTFQVMKHVYDTTAKTTTHSKVGMPTTRLLARRISDRLNEAEIKTEGDPEAPLPTRITSFSICPVMGKATSLQHRA
jgi:hypothetical protein